MGETMERRPEVVVKSADCSGIRGHGKVGDGAPQQFGERACGRASEESHARSPCHFSCVRGKSPGEMRCRRRDRRGAGRVDMRFVIPRVCD